MKKTLFRALSLTLSTALLTGTLSLTALATESGEVTDIIPGETVQWQLIPTDPTAFTDAARIDLWEAAATLAQLGVIAGKDDGSFDPAAQVTRAEAAKLIYCMHMGNRKAEVPVEGPPSSFPDMETHWAKTAAEYCRDLGIIEGRGDGTFDPDAPVTGSELCKMALAALGYDPALYGLTGGDWEINTNALANAPDANLYAGLESLKPNVPVTRAETAQILCNMLKATVIKATIATNEKFSEPYYKYEKATDENGDPVSFLQFRFGLAELPEIPQQPKGNNESTEQETASPRRSL